MINRIEGAIACVDDDVAIAYTRDQKSKCRGFPELWNGLWQPKRVHP